MNLARIKAIIIRHFYNYRHNLDRLSDSFYWPVLDIVIWGLTSQYIQNTGDNVSNIVLILLSALIFWQVIWRSQYEITVNFLEELWNKNLSNLFSTPLKVNEWLAGVFLLGIIKMFITTSFAILVTWLLYSINLFTFGWLLIPFFISLLISGWWIGLIVGGLLVRFGMKIQTLAWVGVYILAPFSAIYYPVDSLPFWARIIAKALPPAYIFEGMREVLIMGKIPYHKLGISFMLNLFYFIIGIFFFKWCFEKSREKGLARLE